MAVNRDQKNTENPQSEHNENWTGDNNQWGYKLVPDNLIRFLEALSHNGNISMSARMIGMSRSTILKFLRSAAG